MKQLLTRSIGAILTLMLGACVMSTVPITAEKSQPADERLAGTWGTMFDSPDGDTEDFFTISVLPNGRLLVVAEPEGDNPMAQPERMEAITANIGGRWYGSVRSLEKPELPNRFVVFRYELETPERLQLFLAPHDALEEAVRLKQIDGKRVPDRHVDMFELDDTAGKLREFVRAHGARVFSHKGPVLNRK